MGNLLFYKRRADMRHSYSRLNYRHSDYSVVERRAKMKLTVTLLVMIYAAISASIAKPFVEDYPDYEPVKRSSATTVIMFTKSKWQEIVQGDLKVYQAVKIIYDPDRLPDGEGPITADMKYSENGNVHSVELESSNDNTSMVSGIFTIPQTATVLIIWFKRSNSTGTYYYDSNYGQNYKFLFNQIVFTDTWQEYVNGGIYPGGEFDVLYSKVRLPWNDTGYLGMAPAWTIFGYAKFSDNGAIVEKILSGPVGTSPMMNTRFHIPNDAQKVIMWFKYSGYTHTAEYDSDYGKNYHFSLSSNETH